MRVRLLAVLMCFLLVSCLGVPLIAAPPEGWPATYDVTFPAGSGLGTHTLTWNDVATQYQLVGGVSQEEIDAGNNFLMVADLGPWHTILPTVQYKEFGDYGSANWRVRVASTDDPIEGPWQVTTTVFDTEGWGVAGFQQPPAPVAAVPEARMASLIPPLSAWCLLRRSLRKRSAVIRRFS